MIHYSNVEHYMCPDCHFLPLKKELSIEELDHLSDFECCCSCHRSEEDDRS